MRKFSAIPLYVKILIGMLLGIIVGYGFLFAGYPAFVVSWIKPWGTIFIKLLKLVAVPLVFVSLIKGVTGMRDIKKLSGTGIKTFTTYIITTSIAVLFGLFMANIIQPGKYFPHEKAEIYKNQAIANIGSKMDSAEKIKNTGFMDYVTDIIPDNIVAAGSDNTKMLQIIFVTLLFGVALVLVGDEKTAPLLKVIDATDLAILKVVDLIMQFAPWGVLALMAGLVADFGGDGDMFAALGIYAVTVILALLILAYVFYPIFIKLFTKRSIKEYLKAVFPIQLLAFSTSSSAATLPFTMEQSEKKLGIKPEISSFVFPLGATINMDGTSCYQAIAILFIAQIFGIDLTVSQMLTVVALTVLASIGTPGIPGGSVVMTVMVLSTIGVPVEGLALILGIDRPLDMLRTVVNVTGDTFVASLINGKVKN
ncbi:MAG: dicarboxylate/amino acid:cation symporter [Paludibacter sp.]|nr:dicarboxylate/amino acid:cation symporter [Paludibacter sp.]